VTSTIALQSRSRPSIASMMGSISFQGGGHDRICLHAIALASSVKRRLAEAVCITRAIRVEHLAPIDMLAIAAVFLDQLVDVIAALAVALGAFELAFDVAEDQISAGHGADSYRRANATRIPAPKCIYRSPRNSRIAAAGVEFPRVPAAESGPALV
jgi:hypothetical protein